MKRILSLGMALALVAQPAMSAPRNHKHHRGAKKADAAAVQHRDGRKSGHVARHHGGKRHVQRHPQRNRHGGARFHGQRGDGSRYQHRRHSIAGQRYWNRLHRGHRWHGRRSNITIRNRNVYRPPVVVYRDWDRGHVHWWNHHHYRWHNNAWVIVEPRFEYYYSNVLPAYPFESSLGTSLVADVQAALEREGYDPGSIDGVIGPDTRAAIAMYQDEHGLGVNGRITEDLLQSLDLAA